MGCGSIPECHQTRVGQWGFCMRLLEDCRQVRLGNAAQKMKKELPHSCRVRAAREKTAQPPSNLTVVAMIQV
jgi:hypothetical protein